MTLRTLATALPLAAALAFFAACGNGGDSNGSGTAGSGGSGGGSPSGGASGKSGAGGKGGTSSSGGSSGSSGSGSSEADAFWRAWAEALCHRHYYCVDVDDQGARARLRAEATNENRCVDLLLENVILRRSRVGALSRGVASGALELQQDWVDRCLAATRMCRYPFTNPAAGEITLDDVRPCREVFEGTVPTGGDCHLSEECAGDAMCLINDAAAGGVCTGTCTPRLAESEACTVDRQCASPPEEWSGCLNLECASFPVATPSAEGASCLMSGVQELCDDDLFCPVSACAPPVALDGACDTGNLYDSVCLDGRCVDGVCTAYVVRTAAGDSCADGELCDSFASLACIGGECVVADGSMDVSCTSAFWFDRALCDPAPLLANGEACTEGAECASGICAPDGCAATLCSEP